MRHVAGRGRYGSRKKWVSPIRQDIAFVLVIEKDRPAKPKSQCGSGFLDVLRVWKALEGA
jgi:hypothetical protein